MTLLEILFWLGLLPAMGVVITAWLFRLPERAAIPRILHLTWNRFLGRYHRFLQGRLLDPGELEYCRCKLLAVRSYSVDRQVMVTRDALCIVTDHRVMVENQQGFHVQLDSNSLRAIRAQREYEARLGFAYWVVMERAGSNLHDPEGDIALRCKDQEQSQALCLAIERTTAVAVPT